MNDSIAIVGMACQYPDAASPGELWTNALAGRRSFRRMPAVRMNPADYLSRDAAVPDSTYVLEAAVIDGYEFDRVAFRVAGGTFRSADLAHWLALDVASRALGDAGFPDGAGLPKETTGVLVGNTLTGEFSRSGLMRLRWPYVRRVLEQELLEAGWAPEERAAFLDGMEIRYKAPFPPVGEETLAGGLSNTIAGRICNYFDLKGGGYTLDGACASSLLAVANACSSLVAGDIDIAVTGGVDLSLDPFELIGFAKTGALAPEMMRVYDARSAGFWPGEGCGFVVLMRTEDAVAQGRRIYASIRGWGISSDGSGGITRPEVEGQILALRRAYRRAGFGIDSVAYFEGHGTGTNVGDATELQTISRARREADAAAPTAAIGSVKAIIGHTKAAAGVAGLIKATMALHHQVIPPTIGCDTPHPVLTERDAALHIVRTAAPWPLDRPLRASVSAMGFGGINTHITLEGAAAERRPRLDARQRTLARSPQDAELFLLGGRDRAALLEQVEGLIEPARAMSFAELTDLADTLAHGLAEPGVRAAAVASTPRELSEQLSELARWIRDGIQRRLETSRGLFLAVGDAEPRIVYLFPGQGSPAHLDGGILCRRFESSRELYERAALPRHGDGISTDVAQPAIVTASRAALEVLERFGITAAAAVGHSLGELTALHWGGACDFDTLLRVARVRGRAMADLGSPTGAMASISAPDADVRDLVAGTTAVIAGLNSPRQTVISGDARTVAAVVERARERGLHAVQLPVSHAFHSPLVAAAAEPLAEALTHETFARLERRVVSTVTGAALEADADIGSLLFRQITSPVRFTEAAACALDRADLAIEVGPGSVLSGLIGSMIDVPVIPTDAGGPSVRGMLAAIGAAFALGAPVSGRELFADRFARAFDPQRTRTFFENPCEQAPAPSGSAGTSAARTSAAEPSVPAARPRLEQRTQPTNGVAASHPEQPAQGPDAAAGDEPLLEVVRRLVAERAELPRESVRDDSRLLIDLHLNSITISQIVVAAARSIGLPALASATDFANATIREVADALESLRATAGEGAVAAPEGAPPGIGEWVRVFAPRLVPEESSETVRPGQPGAWRVIVSDHHPLAESIRAATIPVNGSGVLVCLPEHAGQDSIPLLIESLRVLNETGAKTMVMVQSNGGAAAFARTLHLEKPTVAVTVIDLPFDADAGARVAAEAALAAGNGYREIHFDAAGIRRTPRLELVSFADASMPPLGSDDLLLVTGGGKGIAAECALELARAYGAALALLGRSRPGDDEELAANLARLDDAGIRYEYRSVDVGDAAAVAAALGELQTTMGRPVTAFLHGAGTNVPQLIDGLDDAAFARTLLPKVTGARNVLAALDPDRLRLLVTFSSIIGRAGLRGEGDYALANEWLTQLTEEWGAAHPSCRCLALEWSIWSGVGMGERLGRVEVLLREGIHPITPDAGIATLRRLLESDTNRNVALVITSRFGNLPTVRTERPELPLLRFLESPVVYYPGVEIVAEAEVSADTDPYLRDHTFGGEHVLPGVMGLEAFAQVASALAGTAAGSFTFENVRFERPVTLRGGDRTTLRIAALQRESGEIDLALRCSDTAFAIDHFRATCRIGDAMLEDDADWALPPGLLPFDADAVMYREILFQRGRFRRVRGYRLLRAVECIADVALDAAQSWFSQYLPQRCVLGDPGARDATIHGIQGCIPHKTLLPVAVERIVVAATPADGVLHVHARERWHRDNDYLYDIDVRDGDGTLCEQWRGLLLHAVESNAHTEAWGPVLLGPYVERRIAEIVPRTNVGVAVQQNGHGRRVRSDAALGEAVGVEVRVRRRGDGKPVSHNGTGLSVAHAGDVTLAVAAAGVVGCDIEPVVAREPSLWADLLGEERFRLANLLAAEMGESQDSAATRIWAASESLKKAGESVVAPLTFDAAAADGWATLRSDSTVIGTYADRNGGGPALVVAIAVRHEHDHD